METTYAFLVDVPYLYHEEKKVVCASSLENVVKWLGEHMKAMGVEFRIESIVNLGEVVHSS